ncbi:ABC transporter C family member 1 [Halotydeus destructor]|nr:ABC transporter C family member 1 [Halotydeus destructor]
MDDVFDLADDLTMDDAYDRYCEYRPENNDPRIVWPLVKAFKGHLILGIFYQAFSVTLIFVNPILLDYLLQWLGSDGEPWLGYFYAVIMFAAYQLGSVCNSQYSYVMSKVAMRMRTAMVSCLHRKVMQLAPSARSQYTTGR